MRIPKIKNTSSSSHFAITRTCLLSALDHAGISPLLRLFPTRNHSAIASFLPNCAPLPFFNTLKHFPALPAPAYFVLALLHEARIPSHLHDGCTLLPAWHLALARLDQFHALTLPMAANGLICVATESWRIPVFDF
jgi:hypothetical protein